MRVLQGGGVARPPQDILQRHLSDGQCKAAGLSHMDGYVISTRKAAMRL